MVGPLMFVSSLLTGACGLTGRADYGQTKHSAHRGAGNQGSGAVESDSHIRGLHAVRNFDIR